jgi:hypothetical protein
MKKLINKILTAIIILSGITFGQGGAQGLGQTGIHEHDSFFLRMMYGFGYAELVEKDVLGSDLKYSGFSQDLRFQIGGTVAENLILFGEFGGVMQIDPQFEYMGVTGKATDVTVSVFDFGGGITYYWMPSNIYISLSLLSSQATFEFQGTTGESQYGFGFNGMVGKEWWVGEQWGLGVALYGYFSTMKDDGTINGVNYSSDINNFSVGVMFSATYN